jgi:hypothetical protein
MRTLAPFVLLLAASPLPVSLSACGAAASFAHFGQSVEFDSPHCAAAALTEGK